MIDDSLFAHLPIEQRAHRIRTNSLPPPPRLTLVRAHGMPNESFGTIEAAAARIQALRGRRGLSVRRRSACYSGSVTFEAISLSVKPDGQETDDWLGMLVLPWDEFGDLQAAIRAAAAPSRKAA